MQCRLCNLGYAIHTMHSCMQSTLCNLAAGGKYNHCCAVIDSSSPGLARTSNYVSHPERYVHACSAARYPRYAILYAIHTMQSCYAIQATQSMCTNKLFPHVQLGYAIQAMHTWPLSLGLLTWPLSLDLLTWPLSLGLLTWPVSLGLLTWPFSYTICNLHYLQSTLSAI